MNPNNNFEDAKPIKVAIGINEQIDVYNDKIIIRNKGISNLLNVIAEFKPSDIKKIIIKPAGTLYNGRFEIQTKNLKYNVEFKAYQQQDFEDIKIILGK
ncbi:MAG: hypothetical protein N3E50_02555 [Candidatus Goldbacteria bacterium]|nr:hypothetical protein [Candidatus Goldiibacteriota bacterium]